MRQRLLLLLWLLLLLLLPPPLLPLLRSLGRIRGCEHQRRPPDTAAYPSLRLPELAAHQGRGATRHVSSNPGQRTETLTKGNARTRRKRPILYPPLFCKNSDVPIGQVDGVASGRCNELSGCLNFTVGQLKLIRG